MNGCVNLCGMSWPLCFEIIQASSFICVSKEGKLLMSIVIRLFSVRFHEGVQPRSAFLCSTHTYHQNPSVC